VVWSTAIKDIEMVEHVHLIDVGPRDGLQNEKQIVPAAVKIELIERLVDAGLTHVEAASFVSPKWVPQMADGAQVLEGIKRASGVTYAALVPNTKGLESALAAGVDEVVVFAAASEAFSQKNINCSIAESIERFAPVAQAALAQGKKLKAAISCCLGCPYQGEVPVSAVVDVLRRLRALGVERYGIADTIGVGTPARTREIIDACAAEVGVEKLTGHFHDTYGMAVANVAASLAAGVRTFEASIGGLGGCPYAKGATGNVATEDVVYLLQGMGIDCGIDLHKLVETGAWISAQLGRDYSSRAGKALATKWARV
jgi:hydroxymethylglutaryl-CoA lyase